MFFLTSNFEASCISQECTRAIGAEHLLFSSCLPFSIALPGSMEEEIGVQRICFCSLPPHREQLI